MTEKLNLDAKIATLRANGKTYRKIGEIVHLSHERIRQILIKHKNTNRSKELAQTIFNKIHEQKNMNKYWPIRDLIDALQLQKKIRQPIIRYFEYNDISLLNFKELLEFFLPTKWEILINIHKNLLILNITNIGIITYVSIINHLNAMDINPQIKSEIFDRSYKIIQHLYKQGYPVSDFNITDKRLTNRK